MKSLRRKWILGSHGFILMYSIDSMKTFEKLNVFLEEIELATERKANTLNIIIVGNKCDLEKEREVETEEGEKFAKSINALFKEVSSKTNLNVEQTFGDLIRKIRSNPMRDTKIIKKKKCIIF